MYIAVIFLINITLKNIKLYGKTEFAMCEVVELIKLTCGALQGLSYGETSQHFTSLRAVCGTIRMADLVTQQELPYYLTHK